MELKILTQKQIKGSLWARPAVIFKPLSALSGFVFAAPWSNANITNALFELVDNEMIYQFDDERTRLHHLESPTSTIEELRILSDKILKLAVADGDRDLGIEFGGLVTRDHQLYFFWSGHFGLRYQVGGEVGQKVETLDYFCRQAFVPSRGLGFAGKESFVFGTMSLEPQSKIYLYKDIEFNPLSLDGFAPLIDAWVVELNVT